MNISSNHWGSRAASRYYELAQSGLPPDLIHTYTGRYFNLAWSGLHLALVLELTCSDCILTKEFSKLLYQVTS